MLFDKRNEIKININDYNKLTDTVYEYIEPVTEKKFILKIQEESFDNPKEDEEILFQEFRKLVYLSNEPEIATVNYLVKVNDNRIGYLMEYVEGVTLSEYLKKNTITLDEAIDIIYHICLAIEKAHSMNVFHNDLEHMNNILINNLGFIKIIDFLDLSIFNQKETPNNDIDSIKKISDIIFTKLEEKRDKKIFLEIYFYILTIKSIKNVPRDILAIYKIIFDILHFSPFTVRFFLLLSNLSSEADENFNFLKKDFKIEKSQFDISTEMLEKSLSTKAIKKKYALHLNLIESIGYLGKTLISVNNIDNKYYYYSISLFFTPKILKTINILKKYNLLNSYITLNDLTRTIHDYVFTDNNEIFLEKSHLNSSKEELEKYIQKLINESVKK